MAPQLHEEKSQDGEEYPSSTSQLRPDEDEDSQPSYAASTAALCVCMLTHSYLLISVFPYSGFMAIDLLDSVDEENAGSYAGFIASAFMLGRAITSYSWGKSADRYGRTTVLYTSLGLSCVFSILFGLSPSFPLAIAFRFCLGLVNGIMGTIKTIVSELAKGNERLEARGMGIVVGMWGWGFLVSPAISGALAEPVRQYPNVAWLQKEGSWANTVLQRHPFLLPNLLGAACCLIGMAVVSLFVQETLPQAKRRPVTLITRDMGQWCRNLLPGYRYEGLPVLKTHQSDLELQAKDGEGGEADTPNVVLDTIDTQSPSPTLASIWARKKTRLCLSIYWAYSFVSLTIDETFPLFCISRVAGFGLSEMQIGKILSLCGLIFAVAQYCVYAVIYNRFGLYGSIKVGSMLSAPIMFLMPLSVWLNRGAETGELHSRTFFFLATIAATYRVFALVFFSSISVAVNRSVPASERATMNGLSVLGGSAAKGVGPTFAGFLVAYSVSWFGEYGSILMFGSIGVLGCCVMILALLFLHDDESTEQEDQEIDSKEEGTEQIELIDSTTSNA